MKRNILLVFVGLILSVCVNAQQILRTYAHDIGKLAKVIQVVADKDSNYYVWGELNAGQAATTYQGFNIPASGEFVMKVSPAGTVGWLNSFVYKGAPARFASRKMVINTAGNLFLCGQLSDDLSVTGGPVLKLRNSTDTWFAGLKGDGTWNWFINMGGSNWDGMIDITPNNSGDIIVVATGRSGIYFDGVTLTPTVGQQAAVACYAGTGALNVKWSMLQGVSTSLQNPYSVSVDANDNIYITGKYSKFSWDGNVLPDATPAIGSETGINGYIVKLNSSRVFQWAKAITGRGDQNVDNITTDENGNVIVSGYYTSSSVTTDTTFLGTAIFVSKNSGGKPAGTFIASLSSDGNTVNWSKDISGIYGDKFALLQDDIIGSEHISSLLPAGNKLYIAGNVTKSITFPEGNTISGQYIGGNDRTRAFFGKINIITGELEYVNVFQSDVGNQNSGRNLISTDMYGNFWLGGCFGGTLSYKSKNLLTEATGGSPYIIKMSKDYPTLTILTSGGSGNTNISTGKYSGNVYLSATPSVYNRFDKWIISSMGTSSISTVSVTMSLSDVTATAYFVKQTSLTISASGFGSGTITPTSGTQLFDQGSLLITATPNANSLVSKWNVNGSDVQVGGSSYTVSLNTNTKTVIVYFDVATSLQENNGNNFSEIYPNPTFNDFTVSLKNDYKGIVKFSLYDCTGKIMKEMVLTKSSFDLKTVLSTNGLKTGVYFVRIQQGATTQVKTILKN